MSGPIAIIAPNKNGMETLEKWISGIREHTHIPVRILVVDNDSTDGSFEWLKSQKDIEVFQRTTGVATNMNFLINEVVPHHDIIKLDSDCEVLTDGWIGKFREFQDSYPGIGVGMIGAKFVFPRQPSLSSPPKVEEYLIQESYNVKEDVPIWNFTEDRGQYNTTLEEDTVLGCGTYMTRAGLRAIGGYDIEYDPVWLEDADYGLMLRAAGFKVFTLPSILIAHHNLWRKRNIDEVWKAKLLDHHFAHFQKKWGWDFRESHRYEEEILKRWGNTEVCWRWKK